MAFAGLWQEVKDTIMFKAGDKRPGWRTFLVLGLVLIFLGVSWFWSREPDVFWVNWEIDGQPAPTGYATADTLVRVANTLLEKPGGYLTNDIMPPGLFLDNIPSWEYGVLVQVRDLAKAMRNDYSRSQSQSVENENLSKGEPAFSYDNDSWIFPSTESQYREAIGHFESYRTAIADPAQAGAQFYARADNLREWLAVVEKRLGSLSKRLGASVGESRVNTDLAGERAAENSTPVPDEISVQTPWLQIDNVVFEARGCVWALVHFMRAAENDFQQVLDDKNATVSIRQIIRELEGGLQPLRSPVVLNGSGFGFFANHSLVTASYLSRANSAVINLRELLDQG